MDVSTRTCDISQHTAKFKHHNMCVDLNQNVMNTFFLKAMTETGRNMLMPQRWKPNHFTISPVEFYRKQNYDSTE